MLRNCIVTRMISGLPKQSSVAEYTMAEEAKPTRQCPYCGEMILVVARKCKHCGEFLNGRQRTSAGNKSNAVGQVKKSWSPATFVLCVFLAICLPVVGLLIGLVGLTKKETRSNGLEILIVSIICFIIWAYVVYTLELSSLELF